VVGVLAGLPLVLCLFRPGLAVSMIVFGATGMAATACVIQINTVVTLHIADDQRAHVSGLLSAVLLTAQGLGAVGAGVAADWIGPFAAVALAGMVGMFAAIPVALAWRRR
jgi:predicted MFS family arabinose efflux permease